MDSLTQVELAEKILVGFWNGAEFLIEFHVLHVCFDERTETSHSLGKITFTVDGSIDDFIDRNRCRIGRIARRSLRDAERRRYK